MPIACDICGKVYKDENKMKKLDVAGLQGDDIILLAGYIYMFALSVTRSIGLN